MSSIVVALKDLDISKVSFSAPTEYKSTNLFGIKYENSDVVISLPPLNTAFDVKPYEDKFAIGCKLDGMPEADIEKLKQIENLAWDKIIKEGDATVYFGDKIAKKSDEDLREDKLNSMIKQGVNKETKKLMDPILSIKLPTDLKTGNFKTKFKIGGKLTDIEKDEMETTITRGSEVTAYITLGGYISKTTGFGVTARGHTVRVRQSMNNNAMQFSDDEDVDGSEDASEHEEEVAQSGDEDDFVEVDEEEDPEADFERAVENFGNDEPVEAPAQPKKKRKVVK